MKKSQSTQVSVTECHRFDQMAWFDFAKTLICGNINTKHLLSVDNRNLS
jgi:hypothetical protein